jgi:beta-lactamase superfamily II metal-dependent hydrolase
MCLKNLRPTLSILDVGHGNAAVLQDRDGVVVIDTGSGPHVVRYLNYLQANKVQALLLSHADYDHIGGAITLLLNKNIQIDHVFLNPDSSKDSNVFWQLRYALCEAEKRMNTKIDPSLTTSTILPKNETKIEILYPNVTSALGGVGGKDLSGKRLNSNSLSAAIRISYGTEASVLLGGDIEFGCLDDWKSRGVIPNSNVLVFPHHGGLPSGCDDSDACIFAHNITKMVNPEIIIFSIHKKKYDLPREGILKTIVNLSNNIQFVCTQLPERFYNEVHKNPVWALHRKESGYGHQEGTIEIELSENGISYSFLRQVF